ncbi:hypothetical protein EAG_02515 [Camponotus floridanus]|uniref:Replicase polyprotein 1a n=1 Tax=Camponotus floridanus TaxID=104421 RepID=E2A6X6_CAMFO|nr:hypothetical protein EAG_02515 [Camponotus floridanus]
MFYHQFTGEDDDDDDEDEAPPAAAAPPAPAAAAASSPVAPVNSPQVPLAVAADLSQEAAEDAAAAAESAGDDSGSYEDEGDAEGQAASNVHESTLEAAESISNQVSVNAIGPAPVAPAAPASSEEDDDDDDDDDDDVGLDITEEDDDDDDSEEDDDDDDDEDDEVDEIADIASARHARAEPSGFVPAIYVIKYNRFVDQILGKINNILRANYEPVTVKLTNSNSSKSNKNKNKSKKKGNKKNGTKKSASRPIDTSAVTEKGVSENDVEKVIQATELAITETPAITEKEMISSLALESSTESNMRSRRTSNSNNTNKIINERNKNRKRTKNKTKTKKGSTGSNNKNKKKSTKSRPKARATLYGLASLQRTGDVSVNMMSDHTTIKTKFSLGPLVLKVEKEFGRAAKKELRSATATTAEMSGKLSLRVLHGGAATLHSIRVLQPKQVRVESQDDHDRTREFVWKRSSHIAHLVSQKLSSATRSMLRPPPAA